MAVRHDDDVAKKDVFFEIVRVARPQIDAKVNCVKSVENTEAL